MTPTDAARLVTAGGARVVTLNATVPTARRWATRYATTEVDVAFVPAPQVPNGKVRVYFTATRKEHTP
jgi:hypothetical protein